MGSAYSSGRAAAASGCLPTFELVGTWHDALHGLTYERYQQFKQPFNAHVEGAQLTVVRRGGEQVLVIGAHYPSLAPTNRLLIDGNQAIERCAPGRRVSSASRRLRRSGLQNRTELRIDPVGGRLFQRVESFDRRRSCLHSRRCRNRRSH